MEADIGPCRARILKYYYNTRERICSELYYSGCGGNSNRFSTLGECQSTCRVSIGDQSGAQPGAQPGAETGAESGAQPGAETGAQPDSQTGAQPGPETGAETEDRLSNVETNVRNRGGDVLNPIGNKEIAH